MGRANFGFTPLRIKKFDKGYFPNQDFDDVPDGGSSDCKHVIYYKSALRKMFGMDRINSSQASTTRGNGLFYLDVNGVAKRTAIFGSKFYEDVSGTWTDRTGAVTITDGANNLVQAINHQQNANKYSIYVNNVNPPWKWTGSGNAAVLGGSPPANFGSIAKFHDTIFGAKNENVYFSDVGDPETWNGSKWVIPFERDITRLIDNGNTVAVFSDHNIGSISGYSYLDFSAEESEVRNVGCVGRLAATSAFFGNNNTPVIATISNDGIWLVDQSYGTTKIFGNNFFDSFNKSYMNKSVCAYSTTDKLLYCALPYSSDSENKYLIVIDMVSGAVWPCPDVHTNYIRAISTMKDDSGNEFVYFIDTNGYAFKFNKDTKNYHTGSAIEAIDSRWKSKRYDLEDVYSLRDANMLASISGDWNIAISCAFNLSSDDGDLSQIYLGSTYDLLTSSFVLGASVLGGSDYVFEFINSIGGFGRFFSFTMTNSSVDESFNVYMIEFKMKRRREGSNDK